jgi:hypothetical protein
MRTSPERPAVLAPGQKYRRYPIRSPWYSGPGCVPAWSVAGLRGLRAADAATPLVPGARPWALSRYLARSPSRDDLANYLTVILHRDIGFPFLAGLPSPHKVFRNGKGSGSLGG